MSVSEEDLNKYHGFSQETIKYHYNELASKYDDVLLTVGYPDPEQCAEMCAKYILNFDAPILDMGCGTGLVGQYLKEKGFTNITGVDASSEMIVKSEEKKAYSELEELFLGQPDTFPE